MSASARHLKGSVASPLSVVRRGRATLMRRRGSRHVVPVLIVGGILACAIVFGVLLEQVVLAQSAFRLTHINERVATAQAKHEELLLDAAKLESPGRIERVARTQLGMVDPPVVEYIVADVSPRNPPNRLAQTQDSEELPATGEAAATGPIEGEATP